MPRRPKKPRAYRKNDYDKMAWLNSWPDHLEGGTMNRVTEQSPARPGGEEL